MAGRIPKIPTPPGNANESFRPYSLGPSLLTLKYVLSLCLPLRSCNHSRRGRLLRCNNRSPDRAAFTRSEADYVPRHYIVFVDKSSEQLFDTLESTCKEGRDFRSRLLVG